MQILLFRHAERDSTHFHDSPLSSFGHQQAQALLRDVQSGILPQPNRLWISPKVRTAQTFLPLSQSYAIDALVQDELDERRPQEGATQFRQRIRHLTEQASRQTGTLYLCTHLDWLDEAMSLIPFVDPNGQENLVAWLTGQYIDFDVRDGLWTFVQAGRILW